MLVIRPLAANSDSASVASAVLLAAVLLGVAFAIGELTRRAHELERELGALVGAQAPALLALPGCGVLTAAKLVGESAGVERFADDARLAMHAGAAPLPASSGARQRHRLNRSGNRQLNCALHRIAINQGRLHAPARAPTSHANRPRARAASKHCAV